ncbi:PilW family protein [Desulfonatronum thioautotrophicum]|uniref:PilW family protein n=1 Tax=Desulfonatronum thioautotrophicum TaxID=617001 RepID=UPI0005EB4FB2|nr:PilW family protein [Desulfonatronum thioautotrophicum]
MNSPKNSQSGLSIVEALVTMVILLIVMGGVYQIFQSNSLTYRMQQGMSRMQESGRFAMDFMLNDIRMAGYLGCVSSGTVTNNLANATGINDYSFAVQEFSSHPNQLIIRRALDKRVDILGIDSQTNSTTTLEIDDTDFSFDANEFLVVNNCEAIFITSAQGASNNGTLQVAGGNIPNNFLTNNMGEVLNVGAITYYVQQDPSNNNILSLYREVSHHTTTAQPIVEGIDAIRFWYGIDTNNDRSVDDFVDAAGVSDWSQVRSIRIALLAASPEEIRGMEPDATPSYTLLGDTIIPATDDRRKLRRVFEASIGIRNQLQ